jgi:hypothetical protein
LLVEDSANPDATPFVVSAAGLVGIGTTAPSSALDIGSTLSGGTFASQIFSANNSAAAKTNYVKIDASIALGSATAEAGSYTIQVLQNNAYKTIMTAAGTIANSSNYLAFGTTNEAIRIVSNGTISLGGTIDSESLRVTPVASAVNFLQIAGGATGTDPVLSAQGFDANVDVIISPKGSGNTVVTSTTASTSATTGALVVTGGIGVIGNIWQSGQHIISNATASTSTTSGALVVTGGTGIAGNLIMGGNVVQQSAYYETYGNISNSGGNLTCNFNLGTTFYAALGANVTANFTNVNATTSSVTGATIIVDQGATAYRVANVQVNGVNQTIKWVSASVGVGTASNTDVMSFSLINLGGGAYRVLGQISNYG